MMKALLGARLRFRNYTKTSFVKGFLDIPHTGPTVNDESYS